MGSALVHSEGLADGMTASIVAGCIEQRGISRTGDADGLRLAGLQLGHSDEDGFLVEDEGRLGDIDRIVGIVAKINRDIDIGITHRIPVLMTVDLFTTHHQGLKVIDKLFFRRRRASIFFAADGNEA